MTPRSGRAWLAATAVSLLAAAAPLVADDTLVRRDGGRETGKLQACTHDRCQWGGRSVPRAEIAWIGLGQTGAPPSPADPSRDAVWLADGRTVAGLVAGVSLGVVAIEGQSFDRGEVSWVYFGSSAGPPPLAAEAPSAPSPAAPPPAARPGPPSGAPRAPPVPQPPRGVTAPPAPLPAPAAPQAPAPPPQPAATLVLNEICFLPVEGEPQFVEIKNASAERIALDGVSLRNEKGKTFGLPKGTAIEPGALLLVLFDGKKGGEPGVVHAQATPLLGETGALWLRSKDGLGDGVTWGLPDLASVDLCRGGRCSPPRPGSVLARLPDVMNPLTPAAWAPLDPEHATPGQPNLRPPVSAFAAVPGTIFTGKPRFSWYSVQGAARYSLQVARDQGFTAVVHEASAEPAAVRGLQQLTVHGPDLPPGDYFWRVQALGAGGEAAAFSRPIPFTVDPSRRQPSSSRSSTRALPAHLHQSHARALGDGTGRSAAADPRATEGLLKVLEVPIIDHAKDTRMLALEAPKEKPLWSWDTPDFAGYPYCARAGVAMVNAYYHAKLNLPGKLSQDRIAYEAFGNLREGERTPEYDLPVIGMVDYRISRYALPLAIGTGGEYSLNRHIGDPDGAWDFDACYEHARELSVQECARRGWPPKSDECGQYRLAHEHELPCPDEIAFRWGFELIADIQREINAGRPLIATTPSHLFLIVGYRLQDGQFSLFYQDAGGREELRATAPGLMASYESYWTGLAPVKLGTDEPTIQDASGRPTDSDDDGVLDFDELRRFGTDPNKPDSDDDGVNDKDEIRYSVWDPESGYHNAVAHLPATGTDSMVRDKATGADLTGRDPDRDGKAMELDPDSDNGGCKDGEENLTANGIRDPGETSNFDPADDPTIEPGVCAPRWTGTVEMRLWTRNPNDRRDIHVVAQVLLSEINAEPIVDPGPAHGGRKAGVRLGSLVQLKCVNMTLHETWRDELRTESGGEVTVQVLTAEGSKTIEEFSPTAGGIWRKNGDLDLTPLLGFDLPRDGGIYVFTGCDFEFREDLELLYTCSGSRSCYEPFTAYSQFTGPLGFGRAPLHPPIPCADPEVRQLEGGTRMTGSYSYAVGEGECPTTHGHVSWNICKAGTPCDPPPPLPPVDGETEPGGEGAQRP